MQFNKLRYKDFYYYFYILAFLLIYTFISILSTLYIQKYASSTSKLLISTRLIIDEVCIHLFNP